MQRNTNRLSRPANEGPREPWSDAHPTAHTFLELHRLHDLEVGLGRRLDELAVGLNRGGGEVVAELAARLAMLVDLLARRDFRRVSRGAVVVDVAELSAHNVILRYVRLTNV